VELYLSKELLKDVDLIAKTCAQFSLEYALHAAADGSSVGELAMLAKEINPSIVSFHNVYWDDEWEGIVKLFEGSRAKLCIENTSGVHEPIKFMRRYKMGRCLDLEHLQFETAGVFEEAYIEVIKQADHVHLTHYL